MVHLKHSVEGLDAIRYIAYTNRTNTFRDESGDFSDSFTGSLHCRFKWWT